MWNQTCQSFLRYKELYNTAKADMGGVAGDLRSLIGLVDRIGADPVKKVDFCATLITLMGDGETPEEAWEVVMEKMEPYREVLAEIENQFPDVGLTPVIEVTPA